MPRLLDPVPSLLLLLLLLLLVLAGTASAASLSEAARQRLEQAQPVELIVEYEAGEVEDDAAAFRRRSPRDVDDDATLAFKARRYRQIKEANDMADVTDLADYRHLPLSFKRFLNLAAAQAYARQPGVKALYENARLYAVTAQSLPLIGQPTVAAAGLNGAHGGTPTTVAVIDNGIKLANFGCTAAGTPASCHIAVAQTVGAAGGGDGAHGSNVSGIVLAVAPGARVVMLDAFSGSSAASSDVLAGIDWAIANRSTYNIVAINMSLGDGINYTAPCAAGSAYLTPVALAQAAGISVVAASGNEARSNGMAAPACTPGIISVGAVYDSNLGSKPWSVCTDTATAADKIACFSNSASFLTLLAPGSEIIAGGYIASGTSQASPHVAGAVAVLRNAFPAETLTQTLVRLTSSGVPLSDPRNLIVKPRLNLLEAARPANNAFAARIALSGSSGSTTGSTLLASKESGEPAHAGNAGGRSVWWTWTAPAAGQVALDTHGSGFDTLLAVYTGSAVSALAGVAANDNDGSANGASGLLFQAVTGQNYRIAVDGLDAASGAVTLDWSLDTAAQANLSVTLTGPATGFTGNSYVYVLTAANAGPQAATGVVATLSLPVAASVLTMPSGCAASGATLSCNIGSLVAGASQVLSFQLSWADTMGIQSLAAAIASDLPDAVASDNTGSFQVTLGAGGDGDVPTLPGWGLILLAGLLGRAVLRQ